MKQYLVYQTAQAESDTARAAVKMMQFYTRSQPLVWGTEEQAFVDPTTIPLTKLLPLAYIIPAIRNGRPVPNPETDGLTDAWDIVREDALGRFYVEWPDEEWANAEVLAAIPTGYQILETVPFLGGSMMAEKRTTPQNRAATIGTFALNPGQRAQFLNAVLGPGGASVASVVWEDWTMALTPLARHFGIARARGLAKGKVEVV